MEEHPLSQIIIKESVSEVKTADGVWKKYGLMSKNYNTPYPKGKYLGKSKEIRINSVAHPHLECEYHFWDKGN